MTRNMTIAQSILLIFHLYLSIKVKFGGRENQFIQRIIIVSLVNWTAFAAIMFILEMIQIDEYLKDLIQMTIVKIVYTINLLLIFLFLSRIKIADIQLQANHKSWPVHRTIQRIKWHVKMFRISYVVAFGYLLNYLMNIVYMSN